MQRWSSILRSRSDSSKIFVVSWFLRRLTSFLLVVEPISPVAQFLREAAQHLLAVPSGSWNYIGLNVLDGALYFAFDFTSGPLERFSYSPFFGHTGSIQTPRPRWNRRSDGSASISTGRSVESRRDAVVQWPICFRPLSSACASLTLERTVVVMRNVSGIWRFSHTEKRQLPRETFNNCCHTARRNGEARQRSDPT